MWFRNIFRRNAETEPVAREQTDLNDFSLSGQVFSQLNRLRLRSTQHLSGGGAGQRPSARRRPAYDFREHRKYVPGDDIRFVDWKASARSEQVFLKQGELPKETTIHLLVDTSSSMNWGEIPKRSTVLQLSAALGYLALNGDDRLHLLPLRKTGGPQEEWTFKGKGQFPECWNTLRSLKFGGTSQLLPTIRHLAANNRGGVVLLLSDLLDEPKLGESLSLLPRPAWEMSLFHTLHPLEMAPDLQGEFEMVDIETGGHSNYDVDPKALEAYKVHFEKWRSGLELSCIQHNVFYSLISTGWTLEGDILPHLHRVNVLEPA